MCLSKDRDVYIYSSATVHRLFSNFEINVSIYNHESEWTLFTPTHGQRVKHRRVFNDRDCKQLLRKKWLVLIKFDWNLLRVNY